MHAHTASVTGRFRFLTKKNLSIIINSKDCFALGTTKPPSLGGFEFF